MHDLVDYESIYLDSKAGKDIRYGLLSFKNPEHFWNSSTLAWGTKIEEHRFNVPFISRMSKVLDLVEKEQPLLAGLILTGEGRFWSNGIDVEFIKNHPERANEIQKGLEYIMARVLSMGLVTVALLNGHATAAAGILALCCDFRVMSEKGLFFLPAVQLGIVYSQGFVEVVQSKVKDQRILRDMLLFSERYNSKDLFDIGLVDYLVPSEAAMDTCMRIIRTNFQKHSAELSEVKKRMFKKAITTLTDERVSDTHWSNLTRPKL
jgi:enoyl-CoA hydratase/carnithine racemase